MSSHAKPKKSRLIFVVFLLVFFKTNAQLGFCSGNYGDPIFKDSFGTGSTTPLPKGTTSYRYSSGLPVDGSYSVSSSTNDWYNWHYVKDHTPNDDNGRMLIINADYFAGEFYRTAISGLCENTTYEFSSWMTNISPSFHCNGYPIPINVSFEIWDSSDTTLLASGNTGDILARSEYVWEQYALVFQTLPSQTSVILKMRNNSNGGCGNDLAIDDIMFRACGDAIALKNSDNNNNLISIFKDELPYQVELRAVPDFSVFSSHFYQWQKSENGVYWENIEGENNESFSLNDITGRGYYRVLIAENSSTLSNLSCNVASEIFEVEIKGLSNTEKNVIIVKHGNSVILDKVWIDGAIGKFVQTGEEIVKEGRSNIIIVKETLYTKAIYGYNSTTRTYSITKSENK